MKLSKRCQYALRAVFELSLRNSGKPLKAKDIAKSQGISTRFIEIILNDLKHGKFVVSYRGNDGGYVLAKDSSDITPAEVIGHIEGTVSVDCDNGIGAFEVLWEELNMAIVNTLNKRSFNDLVELEMSLNNKKAIMYSI